MNRVRGPQVVGFNFIIQSFQLSTNLYRPSDDIRVSITTLPEEHKQAVVVPARQMSCANVDFLINITLPDKTIGNDFVSNCTDRIIVVFRRKSFFKGDPIIGSLVIDADSLPEQTVNSMPLRKRYQIYEAISGKDSNSPTNFNERRIVGEMDVSIKYLDPARENDPDEGNYLIDYLPQCGAVDDIIKKENYRDMNNRCYYLNRPYHYESLNS